jgi:hypothetical protein
MSLKEIDIKYKPFLGIPGVEHSAFLFNKYPDKVIKSSSRYFFID